MALDQNTDPGTKPLTPAAEAALREQIEARVTPLRASMDERVGAVTAHLSTVERQIGDVQARVQEIAKHELFANPEALAALKFVIEAQDKLNLLALGKDGQGSMSERLTQLEVLAQKLEKGGGQVKDPLARDPRAEARELYGKRLESDHLLRDTLAVDPRLTVEYERAAEAYIRKGGGNVPTQHQPALGRGMEFHKITSGAPNLATYENAIRPEAVNTLSTDFHPGAGIAVTPTMEQRIIRKVVEVSPLLALAGSGTTTSNRHDFVFESGYYPESVGGGERTAVTVDTERTLWLDGHIDIIDEDVQIELTRAQVEDSGFDIVAELEDMIARTMARRRSRWALTGNGVAQWRGILGDTRIKTINTGSATTMPLFRLAQINLDMLPEYLANASYLMGIGALMSAVIERDSIGRPIWQMSLPDGTPSTIHGFRWYRDPYLDRETGVTDTAVTFATGAKPVILADFSRLFRIMTRRGTTVLRDEVTKPKFIKYTFLARTGAGVWVPDAGRILKVST